MRVLLADDSRTMRNLQKKVLESLDDNIQFDEANDGLEALAAIAAAGRYDLILTEWNMPNMDGHTLVKRIRETDRRTPIVMVTTESEKQRVIDAIRAGVNSYVIKPFTPDGLVEKVKQTLAKLASATTDAA